MIKVFTSGCGPKEAGDDLTNQFETWFDALANIEVTSTHSNSNKYGWMLVVTYKITKK